MLDRASSGGPHELSSPGPLGRPSSWPTCPSTSASTIPTKTSEDRPGSCRRPAGRWCRSAVPGGDDEPVAEPAIDVEAGTPEALLDGGAGRCPRPGRAPARSRGRALVVAPHPDDEVLACGGLLMALVGAGGASASTSSPSPTARAPIRAPPPSGPTGSAARRRREAVLADARLGSAPPALAPPARRRGGSTGGRGFGALVSCCPVPPRRAVRRPLGGGRPPRSRGLRAGRGRRRGSRRRRAARHLPGLGLALGPPGDRRLPLGGACRLPLDRRPAYRRKAAAIAAHRSQVRPPRSTAPADGPVLTEGVLAHFARPFEVFLR